MTQFALVLGFALVFLVLERARPGRELPQSPGWYARTLLLNGCQFGIVLLAGVAWNQWLRGWSLFEIGEWPSVVQGLTGWFIGTFVFYWWHRGRHKVDLFWRVFHQVHHSASRIEVLTSFYKHPLEMAANSILSGAIMFPLLGASTEGAAWFNVFAAVGEYFYHANLRTPHWFGYLIQRPEHHSIHHQDGVHDFNYGDITWWDRLFGTFKDTSEFAPRCGFSAAWRRTWAACSRFALTMSEPNTGRKEKSPCCCFLRLS